MKCFLIVTQIFHATLNHNREAKGKTLHILEVLKPANTKYEAHKTLNEEVSINYPIHYQSVFMVS